MAKDFSAMIYTTEQVREGEARAAKALELSMQQLMQRAAQACLKAIQQQQPAPAQLLVLCGPGNNGGDGWVLARLAQQAGYRVRIVASAPQSELAQQAAQAWRDQGGQVTPLEQLQSQDFVTFDVVVDALLGSGLSRPLSDDFYHAVEALNFARQRQRFWLLSVDVPTGLNSDSGYPQPIAVQADLTLTMVAMKTGLVTALGPNYCGKIELADLAIGPVFYQTEPFVHAIEMNVVSECLPRRLPAAHKGDFGHLVIIGGGPGMSGAASLAGQAALRCGAGKVTVLAHPDAALAIAVSQPELMVHAITEVIEPQLGDLLARATALVIGPGLGLSQWSEALVRQAATWSGPVLWDADALNILATQQLAKPPEATWYLTPHPGEAARLLQCDSAHIQSHRFPSLTQLCQNFQAHVLLKGVGTLVQDAACQQRWICLRGSPALATGGSGDVLSGVAGALLAQQVPAELVLPVAAWLHAVAGERAARHGERGTLASDLMSELHALVNPLQALDTTTER